MKLPRTIADLAECDQIETSRSTARDELIPAHPIGAPLLAEAIQYRPRWVI